MAASKTPRVMSAREMLAQKRRQDEQFRLLFDHIDEDDSGTIEFEELFKALESMDAGITREALKKEWDIIDADESGCLEFAEFRRLMTASFSDGQLDLKARIQRTLGRRLTEISADSPVPVSPVPASGAGPRLTYKLSSSSVRIRRKQEEAAAKQAREVFERIDVDHSGSVDFEELWQAIHSLDSSIARKDLAKEFDFLDTDASKSIEFPEFYRFWTMRMEHRASTTGGMSPRGRAMTTSAIDERSFDFSGEEDMHVVTKLQRALSSHETLRPSLVKSASPRASSAMTPRKKKPRPKGRGSKPKPKSRSKSTKISRTTASSSKSKSKSKSKSSKTKRR